MISAYDASDITVVSIRFDVMVRFNVISFFFFLTLFFDTLPRGMNSEKVLF